MKNFRQVLPAFSFAAVLVLAGCGTTVIPKATTPLATAGISGLVHGGQQPVANAMIQLYAVGITGDGSASTALLTKTVTTDAGGNFNITGDYSCASATDVYITATGGNPGVSNGSNPNLALMTALGPCSALTAGTFISINELTTVAATSALAPFMTSLLAVGSAGTDATALANAFMLASEFVDPAGGVAPGRNVPAGYTVPVAEIDTLGDIAAACVNSTGGFAGDGSVCGTLFYLTTLPGGPAPTTTVAALLNLADDPTMNTAALYALSSPNAPFQPVLTSAPASFKIQLQADSGTAGLQISPSNVVFPSTAVGFTTPPQELTLTNTGAAAISLESIGFTGYGAAFFEATSGCPLTLAPAASCNIAITGTPQGPAEYAATFTLVSNAPNSPQYVPVVMPATAGPTSGPVTVTESLTWLMAGATEDATLTNNGTLPLNIRGFDFDSPAFSQTNTCGTTLAAGHSCVISIIPEVPQPIAYPYGPYYGDLLIDDDASTGPQHIFLTYTTYADFAAVGFGTPDAPLSGPFPVGVPVQGYITFSHLLVTPPTGTFTGPAAADYSYTSGSGCTTPFFPCTVPFTFTPGAAGLRAAQFVPGPTPPYGGGNANATGAEYIPLSAFAGTVSGGALSITPATITFPASIVDFPSDVQTATITNTGSAPVAVTSIAIAGTNPTDFAEENSCPATLAVGASCGVNITATPQAIGAQTASLTVVSDAAVATQPEQLAVTGVAATAGPVSLSASTLTYDIAGLLQDVTLTNNGASPLLISTARYFDTNAVQTSYSVYGPTNFSIYANTCGTSLAAGAACTITVQSDAGAVTDNGSDTPINFTGEVMIVDNASAGPQTVALTSTSASLFAPSIAFPAAGVGFTETVAPISYQADSYHVIYPALDFTYGGADPNDFSSTAQTDGTAGPCQGGQGDNFYTCTVTFAFKPGGSGARSAKAFVNGEQEYVLLTGSGIGSGPSFVVAQTSIALTSELPLAPDPYSVSNATAALSITNTGTTTFHFAITYSGIDPTQMSSDPGTCASVAPGATCTASVTFTPVAAGEYERGTVVVTDSASGFTRTLPITAQSSYWPVTSTPASLSFTSPAIGTTSAAQTIVLADPHGYPLGQALTVALQQNSNFILTQGSSCPASGTQTCTIGVAFSPNATGNFTEYLIVTDETSGVTSGVQLNGAAGLPAVFLSPNPLVFPAQATATPSATTYVSLTNTGTQPLIVSSVTLSGATGGNFTQTNNCVTTLLPNTTCSIGVIFTPAATGPQSASLSVVSNAASSPDSVALSGTGQ